MKLPTTIFAAALGLVAFSGAATAYTYSQAVQQACAADYRTHCSEYGIETSALRLCMNKVGNRLSQSCVNALVRSGEVSQAELDRRQKH